MARTLVEGLSKAAPAVHVHHVDPHLSHNAADIGRWRLGKLFALLNACARVWRLRLRHGRMVFYYVPAPAKRGALYRDLLVMLLCRPFFSALVLHWHAVGLGAWLTTNATAPERWLARTLLGRADLAIILAPELAADAQRLRPQRTAVVANGIDDPGFAVGIRHSDTETDGAHGPVVLATSRRRGHGIEVLFLGLGSREKGLFDTLTAVAIANHQVPGALRLTVAGEFARTDDKAAFHSQAAALGPDVVSHVGFANSTQKRALFSGADVFCFPTRYTHEAQPLVLLEALAHDVPIITTRWRAIPSMLPREHVWFVDAGRPDQLSDALLAARAAPRPAGQLRAHYLTHFTRERHLAALSDALLPFGEESATRSFNPR